VLNVTIDRYAYAFIEPSTDGQIHFLAPDMDLEEVFPPDIDAIMAARLQLHSGVVVRMTQQFCGGIVSPLRVTSFVDAPAGSGLGSSSALVVALVEAFRAYLGLPLGRYDVAHLAFEIERLDLKLAGGKQDQYAATFGGANFIEFLADHRVIVNPLRVPPSQLNELETSTVICFTGVSRQSATIIEDQTRRMTAPDNDLADLHQLKADAVEMKLALLRGEIDHMAEVLNRSWEAKKRTAAGISTALIETLWDKGRAAGAIGGKVSGAGGGGFMMFLVPPPQRVQLIRALNDAGGAASAVHFTSEGAESWSP
jgi:D-glycero-alpha-D-manno-heptose-7-phosphate kinase